MKKVLTKQKLIIAATCLAITTFILVIAYLVSIQCFNKELSESWKFILTLIYFLWILSPPIWFLCEYHQNNYINAEEFEQFKYSQELASRLWAAILLALFIILKGYFKIDLLDFK